MKKIILSLILALATLTATAQDKLIRVADKSTSWRKDKPRGSWGRSCPCDSWERGNETYIYIVVTPDLL